MRKTVKRLLEAVGLVAPAPTTRAPSAPPISPPETAAPAAPAADTLDQATSRLWLGDVDGAVRSLEALRGQAGADELAVRFHLVLAHCLAHRPDAARGEACGLQAERLTEAQRYQLALALEDAELFDLARTHYEALIGNATYGTLVGPRLEHIKKMETGGDPIALEKEVARLVDARYANIQLIASGAMGVVCRAYDTDRAGPVALKLLSPFLVMQAESRQRFLREARTLKDLSHENLVRTFAIHTEPHPHYAMELLIGDTLATLIEREGPLPAERVLAISRQVLAALAYCHEHAIVHRDIKPANIIIPHEGPLKLIDFGIIRTELSTQITQVGQVLGTPAYMSPEQLKGEDLTGVSDLYSFGVVVYQMATGKLPYPADAQLTMRISEGAFKPPSAAGVSTPPALDTFIARSLARAATDRFASANEMLEALEAAYLTAPR